MSQFSAVAHFIFVPMSDQRTISVMKAIEIMRTLSRDNVPFSFSYYSMDETRGKSEGVKRENDVILAQGYRRDQSTKSEILASYLRMNSGERRQFYIPLMIELNGIKIKQ